MLQVCKMFVNYNPLKIGESCKDGESKYAPILRNSCISAVGAAMLSVEHPRGAMVLHCDTLQTMLAQRINARCTDHTKQENLTQSRIWTTDCTHQVT